MKQIAPSIYFDGSSYIERLTLEVDGRKFRTTRKLHATNPEDAKIEHATKLSDHHRSKLGLCKDPYAKRQVGSTLKELAEAYIEVGAPNRKDEQRKGHDLVYLTNQISIIMEFWGNRSIKEITPKSWKDYWKWRRTKIVRGTGDRIVDCDRILFASIIDWAYAEEITDCPSPFNRNFKKFADPVHCRDKRPQDADELHKIAAYFLSNRKSETLGWQFLFECLTGCRTSEIISLRTDATNRNQPGFISDGHIWIKRAKGGVKNFVKIFPALEQCMLAHRRWLADRFPDSKLWFPSARTDERISEGALTHALKRACADLGIEGERTSHGCRAYRVCVLRSEGMEDGLIALDLGQRSGAGLITSVYGESTPERVGYEPLRVGRAWDLWAEPANVLKFG